MKKRLPLILVIISTLMLSSIVVFMNSINISSFDTWFYDKTATAMNPSLTLAMRFITESGNSTTVIILCLSLFLFTSTRAILAFPISISVIAASISNVLLKLLFARERPNILRLIDEDSYSFPSGHAMINMAFYSMLLFLTWRYVKNKKVKYMISFLCLLMPLIIGFSRIYLGVHYATDVIAGWLLGFVISAIIFSIFYKKNDEV